MTKTPTYRQLYVIIVSMKLSEEQLGELRAAITPGTYDRSVSARAQIVLWYHEGRRKLTSQRCLARRGRPLTSGLTGMRYMGSAGSPARRLLAGPGRFPNASGGGCWRLPGRRRQRSLGFRTGRRGRWPITSGRPRVSGFPAVGLAAMAGQQASAVAAGHIQDQQRPGLRGEGPRRHQSLSESAGG